MASSDEALQGAEEREDATAAAAYEEPGEDDDEQHNEAAEIEVYDRSKQDEGGEEEETAQAMSGEEDELDEHEELDPQLQNKEVNGDEEQAAGEPTSLSKLFPLTKVKKIVRLDKDIKLVARPALMAIAQAAQLFVEGLTAEAFSASLRSKRKSLRVADLETAVRSKRKFLDCLDDSMEIFAETTNRDKEDAEHSQSKASTDKSSLLPPGTRSIRDFFT